MIVAQGTRTHLSEERLTTLNSALQRVSLVCIRAKSSVFSLTLPFVCLFDVTQQQVHLIPHPKAIQRFFFGNTNCSQWENAYLMDFLTTIQAKLQNEVLLGLQKQEFARLSPVPLLKV